MKKIFILAFLCICGIAVANEFIVKKSKKLPSLTKLKEKCCSCFAQQHNCISEVVTNLVGLQKTEFDVLSVEVDGESRLGKVSKPILQQLVDKSAVFEKELRSFEQRVKEYHTFINNALKNCR